MRVRKKSIRLVHYKTAGSSNKTTAAATGSRPEPSPTFAIAHAYCDRVAKGGKSTNFALFQVRRLPDSVVNSFDDIFEGWESQRKERRGVRRTNCE